MSRRALISLGSLLVVAACVALNSTGVTSSLLAPIASSTSSGDAAAAASQEAAAAVPYVIVPHESVTLVTEPDAGSAPVLSRITDASTSIDLVMYELNDTHVEDALVKAEQNGVKVRVLLNDGLYGDGKGASANTSAYTYLQSHNVPVKWTPASFALTHQKTLITDSNDAFIMTFNLTPKYYATSRDFGVDDPDTNDVQAAEAVFNADWNDTKIAVPEGDDLVWSPGSKPQLLAMINAAKTSLLIYNEEIEDPDVIAALVAAVRRGASVKIIMTDDTEWHDAFTQITNAGGEVRTYAPNASLYIHAKMILADGTQVFLGSENFSTSSLDDNRELGLFISTPPIISQLTSVFNTDWPTATKF